MTPPGAIQIHVTNDNITVLWCHKGGVTRRWDHAAGLPPEFQADTLQQIFRAAGEIIRKDEADSQD